MLVIGLVALIGLITFQVRSIPRVTIPGTRAVEALATSLWLPLVLFASTYCDRPPVPPGASASS